MTAGLRFFYRHIHVTGLANIPTQGPVILIANHHSSLMDAALLGILLKRKAYFFARGDVFVNKPVRRILWWFHMMPVHSHQRGKNTLQVNRASFSDGKQLLLDGRIIVFFPESNSHVEHQLLPFRKGVFRLAFDAAAAAEFSFDIPIVPVGITYDHPVNGGASVQVHVGKPLLLSAYVHEYRQNAAAALLHICKDAHLAMHQLVLHVKDKSRLHTAGQYLVMSRNDHPLPPTPWKILSARQLRVEQAICAAINNAPEKTFINQKRQADTYFTSLAAAGIKDSTIAKPLGFAVWKTMLVWLGFPLYIIALLLNALPVVVARQVTDKKVYRKDFYSWIFVVCYSFGYLFWLLVLATVALLVFPLSWTAGLLVCTMATGVYAWLYARWLQNSRQQQRWQRLTADAKAALPSMRKACRNSLAAAPLVPAEN